MSRFRLNVRQPLEKEIQNSILEYLHFKGIFCWKEHSSGIMIDGGKRYMPLGLRGKADILGVYKGRFLAIEVKRPHGRLSAEQEAFLSQIEANGGLAFVATSIDDVIAKGL